MASVNVRTAVKALIRENVESSALEGYGDVATLSLNDLIEANIMPSVVAVYGMAPDSVWSDAVEREAVANKATGKQWLRVLSVTVGGVPAVVEVNSRSSAYEIASDKLNGSLGVASRPYVLIEGTSVTAIPAGATSITGVTKPTATDGTVSLETNLAQAVCYWCAYLVMMAMGGGNAEQYRQQALASMGLATQGQQQG